MFFSTAMVGTALGTLLTGTVGSVVSEAFGWPAVFYAIGLVALVWVAVLKYYAMETHRQRRQVRSPPRKRESEWKINNCCLH